MLDRESSFADNEVIRLLQEDFVPVAVDCWYEERRQDPVGEFYRRVIDQREGMRPGRTTQGFYACSPNGDLLRGWNNRNVERLRNYLRQVAKEYRPVEAGELTGDIDARYDRSLPDGAVVVDVFAKITDADWPPGDGSIRDIFRSSIGRDHLWILEDEVAELGRGVFPERLARRIARFHLIDNTRGEPPMWRPGELRAVRMELNGAELNGSAAVAVDGAIPGAQQRGYQASLRGVVTADGDRLTRFDVVARGLYWGHGPYTGGAPAGLFELTVALTLAAVDDEATGVPPQASRDLRGYLAAAGSGRQR